jgi:tetratricopeptide (TPR) repeat protein
MEKRMYKRAPSDPHKKVSIQILSALLFFFCFLSAPSILLSREISDQEVLSSSVGQKFYELAYELASSEDINVQQTEQAMVFLSAAMQFGNNNIDAHALLIKLACRISRKNNSELVYNLLVNYVDETADVGLAKQAVEYLLAQLNTRQQRENLLEEILGVVGDKNVVLSSELTMMLGQLKAEKGDVEVAEFYLMQAYKKNRYNKTAFTKLMEIKPERIGPTIYLERLRLALHENPTDIEAALAFAQQAEQLQLYDTAAGAYEYCANLFKYLYPSEPFPARIYLPWSISSYNSERNQSKCLEIAQEIEQQGRFDLRLEAIAGKVLTKMGNGEVATKIFQDAERKALQLLSEDPTQTTNKFENLPRRDFEEVTINQLAWFYCFALPIPEKALHWANKANLAEPNSPTSIAILAYALMMNNQIEWAKPIINKSRDNQISDLTLAQIQLAQGQKDSAIETLKAAIARDPGSFAAERAKEIMDQQGLQYTAPIDSDFVLNMLEKVFDQTLVPEFTAPENMLSGRLNIRGGDEFQFGSEFKGDVEIANNSVEPLVISDDALFKGNIRIDADISGDLNETIPNLFSVKIRTVLFIEPGRNIVIPVRLFTGRLREILLTYPQASLSIDFTLYLDPVTTNQGNITNRLTNIEPTRLGIKRPGVKLTGQYLRSRFNLIGKENINEKIKIARLFISLLREQYEMLNKKTLYRFMYADWMEPLLRNALLHETGLLRGSTDGQWVVKVHTMAELLSLPLDYELIGAVATNLNSTNWAVRMMAVYLLGKSDDSGFDKVLDWMAKNDSNKYVRDMAIALSGSASVR